MCGYDKFGGADVTGIPVYVREVLNKLSQAGYQAFLVGGCVRDMLIGRSIHDWDVATSAKGAEVAALFPKTVDTGVRFGTVIVVTGSGNVEVTTFRSDGVYSDSRRPDQVEFVDNLREDLKRRDFTMNAMAMQADGEIIDLFGGREDIGRRLIRCVGDPTARFNEDALRMLRALRFSAQLEFSIEDKTLAAIRFCSSRCAALSSERVRDETEKILMTDFPELIGKALELGLYTGRLQYVQRAPEILGRIAGLPEERMLRWAAFSAVAVAEKIADSADRFLKDMRLDAATVKACALGAAEAQNGPLKRDLLSLKRLLANRGEAAALCAAAASEVLYGEAVLDAVRNVLSGGECWSVKALAVSGDDLITLGFSQGGAIGRAIQALLEHVLEHPEDNERATLLKLAAENKE